MIQPKSLVRVFDKFKEIPDIDFAYELALDFYWDEEAEQVIRLRLPKLLNQEVLIKLWNDLKKAYRFEGDDEEFASAIDIYFYITADGKVKSLTDFSDSEFNDTDVIASIWSQLRYAYGYRPYGICNSEHYKQYIAGTASEYA